MKKLLRLTIIASFLVTVSIIVSSVVLVYFGATGKTEFSLFGQRFESTNVGIAGIFIGAVSFVLLIRRVLKLAAGTLREKEEGRSTGLCIGDVKVEPPAFWHSKNIVTFSLWYFGKGLAYVDEIGAEVQEVSEIDCIKMQGAGAIPEEYRFRVHLSPETGITLITKRPFTYRSGELDTFRVEFLSPGGYRYRLLVYAAWHDKRNPDRVQRVTTQVLTMEFPIEDLDQALDVLDRLQVDPEEDLD